MTKPKLSFRDECAIQAMQALISAGMKVDRADDVARFAYAFADAMVQERKDRER